MYTVTLRYKNNEDVMAQDVHTHTATLDLFLKHQIESSQNSHNTIILHRASDLTVALLALSNHPLYDAVIQSKKPV
jgi:hypothetical protein